MPLKTSLAFILNAVESPEPEAVTIVVASNPRLRGRHETSTITTTKQQRPARARLGPDPRLRSFVPIIPWMGSGSRIRPTTNNDEAHRDGKNKPEKPATAPFCPESGCTSLIVSHGRCVRHGGGSRCQSEGCTKGAKRNGLCFQHGGSTVCLSAGCSRKAKVYGYCWSHGGGLRCDISGCGKVAAKGRLCWAHGGGNRCRKDGCSRRSYQKYGYHCKIHTTDGPTGNCRPS